MPSGTEILFSYVNFCHISVRHAVVASCRNIAANRCYYRIIWRLPPQPHSLYFSLSPPIYPRSQLRQLLPSFEVDSPTTGLEAIVAASGQFSPLDSPVGQREAFIVHGLFLITNVSYTKLDSISKIPAQFRAFLLQCDLLLSVSKTSC